MSRYKAYVEYKESGVEWLNSIPQHWEMNRLKHACNVYPSNVDKKTHDGEAAVFLCNYTDVYYNEKIDRSLDFMPASASADQIEKFTLRGGDTIITKDSETAEDIAIAAYVPDGLPGVICGYHLSVIRPNSDTCGAFVKRLFDSIYAKSNFSVLANGLTRVGLSQYALDNVEMPWPPVEEQEEIATFLDHETAKIDALIEKQQRLIELLKEKRQAVISHAVTKGLNPKATMKDSGVEWLGDVPAHWKVASLKYLVATPIIDGPHVTPTKHEQGIPFISAEAISRGFIDFDKIWGYISEKDHEIYSKRYRPQVGDILMVKLGATTGNLALVETSDDFSIWVPLAAIRVGKQTPSKFIYYLLQSSSVRDAIQLSWTFGTQQTLGLGTLANLNLPIPPANECVEIINSIESKIPILEASVERCERSLALLQERRTALISAAVTGKIDVRDWQAAA